MARIPIRQFAFRLFIASNAFAVFAAPVVADEQPAKKPTSTSSDTDRQAALETGLTKMLSGATLEGSFTNTGAGGDPTKLSRDKYTLGEVKKVAGNVWQFPARIQYGEKDVTIPIMLPIRWAGDTPVVTVDELPLPGFGTVSARVMFFANHYAGYWKHGDHGGHMFGVIHPAAEKAKPPGDSPKNAPTSGSNPSANK